MSLLLATWIGAGATVVLAVGAGFTVYYARRAFREQSKELAVLQGQLESQHDQFNEQRKVNEQQTGVLELQHKELEQSLAQRKRDADQLELAQASQVAAWFDLRTVEGWHSLGAPVPPSREWGAVIRNASDLPVLDVQVSFSFITQKTDGSWVPTPRGGLAENIRVIPPQTDRFKKIPDDIASKHDECDDQVYAVSIRFTDAAGIKWERDARGALKRD